MPQECTYFQNRCLPVLETMRARKLMNLVPRGLDLNPNFTAASHSTFLPFCVNYKFVERRSVLSSLLSFSLLMDLKVVFKL